LQITKFVPDMDLSVHNLIVADDSFPQEISFSGNIIFLKLDKPAPQNAIILQKPFRMGAFLELINSQADLIIVLNGIYIDLSARTITNESNDKIIDLTDKETQLIKLLHENPESLTKERILQEIWMYDANIDTHTLETHIYRLRQKFLQNFSNN